MIERASAVKNVLQGLTPVMSECGFPDCSRLDRETGDVYDFSGEKGVLRLVFGEDRIHLLSGEKDTNRADDAAFDTNSTFLFQTFEEEFDDRVLKSLTNEISETLRDTYGKKAAIVSKKKQVQTVSRTAARSGTLAYDPVTLATKIAAAYPELKPALQENLDKYDEFLCEEFFVEHANALLWNDIRIGNPQRMKKIFNILGDVYEDGTNEVQSLIAVTILGPVLSDPTVVQKVIPYLTDTMLEPVLAAGERLKKSRSSRMRLENPPKYKPKKVKQKKGLMSRLMEQQNI